MRLLSGFTLKYFLGTRILHLKPPAIAQQTCYTIVVYTTKVYMFVCVPHNIADSTPQRYPQCLMVNNKELERTEVHFFATNIRLEQFLPTHRLFITKNTF